MFFEKIKPRPLVRTIRARLTLLFALILTVSMFTFSYVLYSSFSQIHQNEFDRALYNHAVDISNSVDFDLFGSLSVNPGIVYNREKILPFPLGRTLLQIRRRDGMTVLRSNELGQADLPYEEGTMNGLDTEGATISDVQSDRLGLPAERAPLRLINYLVKRPGYPILILQVAVPQTFIRAEKRGLLNLFLVAVPLIIFVAGFGGYYFSRRALLPVNQIIQKTNSINAGRLTDRLPVPAVEDEMQRLALTINGLLDRLQIAFDSQERFIADASHQLKTPLAVMRGELDVLVSRPREMIEVLNFLKSASQEVVILSKTVEDLLLLARIDGGRQALYLSEIRLDEILLSEISRLEKIAKAKNVQLKLDLLGFEGTETPPVVKGDKDLVGHLIYNLIENAIKYSPNDAMVRIELINSSQIEIRVTDKGPGVRVEDQSKIFERFFRADSGRPGVGLGLAIAQKIAQLHGSAIGLQSEAGQGSIFSIQINKI